MKGSVVDDLIFGGPAYSCRLLDKGDIILEVNDESTPRDSIQEALSGEYVPWSTVSLTVQKKSGEVMQTTLCRISEAIVSIRCELLDLLSACKVMFAVLCLYHQHERPLFAGGCSTARRPIRGKQHRNLQRALGTCDDGGRGPRAHLGGAY